MTDVDVQLTQPGAICDFCPDKLRCEGCSELLDDCECVFYERGNAPDVYCATCNPEIHAAALERAEQNRRYEELLRQTDIDEGYNPYED